MSRATKEINRITGAIIGISGRLIVCALVVDFMPKKISAANQEFFKKGENSLASGIKKCKRGK